MTDFPQTRHSLIVQLQSASDRQAWEDFVRIYQPVVYRIARRRGLQDSDARDATQQIMMNVASAIQRWEPSENKEIRFRNWLRRVAKNTVLNVLTRRGKNQAIGGTEFNEIVNRQPDAAETPDHWFEQEYRREIYRQASQKVKAEVDSETWEAFHLTVINEMPIREAASQLGKPVGSIYAARSRIMKRLQTRVAEIEKANS